MQSDDDLQTTLSKWPFILGDVLLVTTALAIAILGQWQLSNWQVASCVISVALGAGLFVLPYIVEFRVRVREEAEDHNADLRILQRQLVSAHDQLEAVSDRIESLETELSNLARATSKPVDLKAPIADLESKIEPLTRAHTEQSSQLEALASQMLSLTKLIESKPGTEAIDALQAEITSLQVKVAELPTQVAPAEVAAQVKQPAAEEAKPKEAVEVKAKKTREPRKRRSSEPRLLQRAIEQKQDKSSDAVSRIIKSEPKPKEALKTEPVEPKPEEVVEPIVEEPTKPAAAEPAAEPEDMFGDVVPVQVKKAARTKKSDTAAIASVFIGIGNKPFVRGSGAGLTWESGVAMEFEEIGKWRWIAPADLEERVEIQLFRNDEDPDTTGKYILEPGQQLELAPVF